MAGVENRVAVITGGARGIGAATASKLAAAGAKVAILDLNGDAAAETAAAITASGGTALGLAANVTDRERMTEVLANVAEEFGGVDILMNNAGVLRDNLLFKMSDGDWDLVMDVHLKGAFITTQIAQRYMVEQKYGRIISMSSISADGWRGQTNYAAAKAGLRGFTRTLAVELGPFGITANCISPGFIETEMTRETAERIGTTIEEMRDQAAANTPVRRGGVPDDIANAVLFLASEESSFITGHNLYVTGGND